MDSNQKPDSRFDQNRFFLKNITRTAVDFPQTGQNRRLLAPSARSLVRRMMRAWFTRTVGKR